MWIIKLYAVNVPVFSLIELDKFYILHLSPIRNATPILAGYLE